ncbi:MAG TPA: hypothetical protein H9672_02240 [Firmicutes bacterium]|nr:hypothetical protein [Bacillota bacterium]
MVDLHVHILPGLDDGSQSMEESLELAELALEGGVSLLAATPHSNQEGRFENFFSGELKAEYEAFCRALAEERLPLGVVLGMEIFATEDMRDKIKSGQLTGLNGSRYYLVEFAFDAEPDWIGERLEDVLELGRIPLIAHPERYFCVQEYPALVYEWLRLGCCTQLNKGSLLGRFGRHAARSAAQLLEYDLVTCVASDAHSPYMRTTYMGDVRDYLEERLGEERALRLLERNPERILYGRTVPGHGRPPERRKTIFW